MPRRIFALIFLLTVGNLALCQDWENLLFITMGKLIEKQEAALMKQEAALSQLKEMQEKFQHVESNLQDFHHELGHLKDAVNSNQDLLHNISAKLETLEEIHQETKGCIGREDLEHFKNISSSRQKELENSFLQEISQVVSLLETGGIDECLEGSHNCSDYGTCKDKLFTYGCSCLPGFAGDGSHCEDIDECTEGKEKCSTLATCRNSVGNYSCSCNPPFEGDGQSCNCPSGFAQNGSNCEDIDECAQGKDECSPQATCRNSVRSYSCSCNPPFEGDGRTCEFPCERPAKVFEGLGCLKLVEELKTFEEMNYFCHQDGWRLLQNLSYTSLQEIGQAFDIYRVWIGVHERRWQESGLPLPKEIWKEASRGSDPSGRKGLCGVIYRDRSYSSLYKVEQRDCSDRHHGVCQFVISPQK